MDELTPTENSKVIPIRIDPFTTSDRSGLIKTNKKFYTTDTDAWLHFEIAGMSSSEGEYSLALTNRSDGSVFQRRGELEANEFYYKLNTEESDQNEVKHAGKWIGQVYVTLANGNSTAARFEFSIEGHLLDGRETRVIIIQDFNTLMNQLNDLKDELNVDVTALKEKFEKNNADAKDLLEQLGDMIQEDVVSLKVQERYEDLEAEYAQKLTEVTTQLAQTNEQFNQAVGAITEDSEVVMARNSTISGATYNILGQRIDDLELAIMTEAGHIPTDYSSAPGSKVLVGGNRDNGFYGFVQPHEFGEIENNPEGNKNMSASNLALAIGLTNGTAINEATAWIKFSRGGEIYLVPVKPLRRSVTWNAIYNQGAVYGDGTSGITPPDGRAGKRLSVSASSNAFLIDAGTDDGFLRSGAVTAAVGDTLVSRGFSNSDNNGEFTVSDISDTAITVTGGALVDESDAVNASVYAKHKVVSQNRDVTIGGNRYRVQLLKGAARDPLDSYLDSDRGLVGPNSEWNHLILPLHERARLQNWRYPTHAGGTEDWGIGLTDADLVTHHTEGLGSYTWCQETSDDTSYRRVGRGFLGASGGYRDPSWHTSTYYGWRPALRLLS